MDFVAWNIRISFAIVIEPGAGTTCKAFKFGHMGIFDGSKGANVRLNVIRAQIPYLLITFLIKNNIAIQFNKPQWIQFYKSSSYEKVTLYPQFLHCHLTSRAGRSHSASHSLLPWASAPLVVRTAKLRATTAPVAKRTGAVPVQIFSCAMHPRLYK